MSTRRPRTGGAAAGEPRVVWTDRALSDLREIGDFIAEDDPVAAERWITVLMRKAESVTTLPRAGRVVPEIGREDVREVFKKAYRIVYRVGEKRIEILTVFEGHRRFPRGVIDDESAASR